MIAGNGKALIGLLRKETDVELKKTDRAVPVHDGDDDATDEIVRLLEEKP